MHLHAYSKASYQTHTNTLCHLHELQIISGTSVQIRTGTQISPGRESEKQKCREGRTKSKSLARWCDCKPSSAATKPGEYSVNRPAWKYHSRSFCFQNLPGRGSPEPGSAASLAADCQAAQIGVESEHSNQSVGKKKKIEFDFKSAQQHRLATRTATTGGKKSRDLSV